MHVCYWAFLRNIISWNIYYFYSMFTFLYGFDNWHTSRTYVGLVLLAYALFWTCVRWLVGSFFPYDFLKSSNFSGSYYFIMVKNLLLYIRSLLYLFVLWKDRFFTACICFKETLFSNFSCTLFNKYFSLLQSTFQFRVSVQRLAKIVMLMYVVFIILL